MLRPPCVTHSREHTSEILNTATLSLSHSLSFFFLLSIFFLIFIPLFIVSTFSLRAPAITGLMVGGLVKFPDATAARLFGKMAAEEMIPRRLEGGGGGRLCPFSDHTSSSRPHVDDDEAKHNCLPN